MGPVEVVIRAPILGADLSYVAGFDQRVRITDVNRATDAQLRDALARAEVLLIGFPVPEVVAAIAPRLRWAHHTQAGVSNLLRSDLWTSDVMLTSSRGYVSATAIAESVMAGAYYFARGFQEAIRQHRAGEFSRFGYSEMATLTGATMGVIGLGGIGREVARLGQAAGMRVVGTRQSVTAAIHNHEGVELILPANRIDEIAAQSDYLVICSQLTDQTRGMVNSQVFDAMKPQGVLINIARGEEVDEDALIAAVTSGRIRGAMLDVYADESVPPRRELIDLPQILLTPHISGQGGAGRIEPMREIFVENLHRYLNGRELVNVVDRQRGY